MRLLAERIRTLETSSRLNEPTTIPLGAYGLGDLFPAGRLSSGSLVELLPRVPGAGADIIGIEQEGVIGVKGHVVRAVLAE